VNYNQFAERQYGGSSIYGQYDLNTPNRIIKEGDKYAYNYLSYFTKAKAWAQASFTYNHIDFFIAGNAGIHHFYRQGKYRNGLYPAISFGNSEKQKFTTYGFKGGITYKING